MERTAKQESSQKVDPGEENYPAAPAGIQTCDLSITSALTTELSCSPVACVCVCVGGGEGGGQGGNWQENPQQAEGYLTVSAL